MTPLTIQRALTTAGFDPGAVDGKFGPKSKAAVKAFQRSRKLLADGVVGKKTAAALKAFVPAAPAPAPAPVPAIEPPLATASRPLSRASLDRLRGVHPSLIAVVKRAAELHPQAFRVTCGVRTLAEQRVLVAKGASKTMRSRHLPGAKTGLSHAIDVAFVIDGKVRWDWPLFDKLAKTMKRAARELKVPVEWGGDWPRFRDGPHFQLPWGSYPG